MRQQVSKAAIELIKRFEGYRGRAAQLPDGRWTIGYGHTQTARQGAEVSEADAEALLMYDLIGVSHAVNDLTYTPLTQNQFDALCAFAFNIGVENFRHSSVLRRINEGALIEAACAMELWRKADFEGERIVIDALVRRRSVEKTLFLTPPDGWRPAPTPLLPPQIDADRIGAVPQQSPIALCEADDDGRLVLKRDETPAPRPAPPRADEDDEGPIAAAAAATIARLQALAPDEPTHAPANDLAAPVEAVIEGEPDRAVETAVQADDAAPEEPKDEPPAIRTVSGLPLENPAKPPSPTPAASGPLVLLGMVGLALFAWALYWAFAAEPDKAGGIASPLALAWFMGVVGIGCFGVAAYLLLERLGGEEPRRGAPRF